MRTTTIYALIDPENNEVRYVGKTVNLKARFHRHCNPVIDNYTHSACWVRSLKIKPEMITLEEVPHGEDWVEAEQFWIAYMKALGARLTNLSFGGEGPLGIKQSQATCDKRSNSLKGRPSPMKGRKQTEKWLNEVAFANKGKKRTSEQNAAQSERQKDKPKSEETKAKISANHKIVFNTPEMFEKLSVQRKGRPAWNKGIFGPSGQKRSDETRALLSDLAKLREQKKRDENFVVSEETRRKLSESGKRFNSQVFVIEDIAVN